MDIDIERLKTDAAYWDEVAPEEARHYCAGDKAFKSKWADPCWHCIPRPTKPAAPEWDGEGLPPVGVVCECFSDGVESERCEIVAYDDQNVCVRWWKFNNGRLDVLRKNHWKFRPIRTKAQSQVFDLGWVIQKAYEQGDGGVDFNEFAKAIIAAGWKKDA